ncbi:helix-turn-helix domain-containing protein [Streptomyces sp. NBC_00878]|uniref:helix-turn-helix domain-containing protein n=1 Tax=Streptomyces sp. NBC_00878 TaxID=2975854 RepID=UPI002252D51C|nr:helix-turn-helix domain-containing protein [Streptomyces sp. NBC_00878]MCX4908065.1 helix-turn-helix domain-containing protein [Streptomyces sp. NBC_00878]
MDQERREEPVPSVGKVVGENLRRLRKRRRWTQEALATQLATVGLNWKRAQIADLESGRRETVDLGTLVVLAFVFGAPVHWLLEGESNVLLTPRADMPAHGAVMSREQLRAAIAGEENYTVTIEGSDSVKAKWDHWRHEEREIPVKLDKELARQLDVDVVRIVSAADGLWGRSLTEERERRVAELGDLPISERQARQGHITRELKSALTKWVLEGEEPADE